MSACRDRLHAINSGGVAHIELQRCGARRRRDGEPCRGRRLPGKHRCKWHGGASTGPKTTLGKRRALQNLRRGQVPSGAVRTDLECA